MRNYKIEKIETSGVPDRVRIHGKTHYRLLQARFDPRQRNTPCWGNLQEYGPIDGLWLLKNEFTLTVHFKSGGWIQAKFMPGFIWDGASDPLFKEWILEIVAAMLHDLLGSLHLLFPDDNNKGFRVANKIFLQMVYYAIKHNDFGYNWFKRYLLRRRVRKHYVAISGIYARSLYESRSPLRAPNHSRTTKFTCSRNSEFGRKN